MEESGRRESFAPTYGVHINPVSKGKQIPLCSSGQGCTHEGGPFQRPPIDCTDLNYRTLKKSLFSIHHTTSQLHSGTKWQNPPKFREINWSIICLLIRRILDMKCMQWPETEVIWIYYKTRQKFVKLAVFDSLTNFWIWSAWCNDRKRKLCESTETCLEKFIKSL